MTWFLPTSLILSLGIFSALGWSFCSFNSSVYLGAFSPTVPESTTFSLTPQMATLPAALDSSHCLEPTDDHLVSTSPITQIHVHQGSSIHLFSFLDRTYHYLKPSYLVHFKVSLLSWESKHCEGRVVFCLICPVFTTSELGLVGTQ